jgi:hypothetical protein
MTHLGLARAIGGRITALATLGDGPRDTDEEKLEHHFSSTWGS